MNCEVDRCDVLFLIRTMGRGGAERQLSLLARALKSRGLSVVVAVFYAGGSLERELRAAGVEILDLKKAGRWSNIGVLIRLLSFVRRRRPRVLHSYMATQNVMALLLRPFLARADCAVVAGIRTSLPNAWRYNKVAGLVDFLQAAMLCQADRVISNSATALRALHGRIPNGRGFIVPNGVDVDAFSPCPDSRESLRRAWGVPTDMVLIGLVGRLDPQKNHILLIDALKHAGDALSGAMLVIVGEGDAGYTGVVKARAESFGMASRIIWAGASDEMSSIYSALDILCLCSVVEGFPNVLAEGMSAGLPCVTTDVGDAAELVGDFGWVVPSNSVESLSRALCEIHKALSTWDGASARCRVAQHFGVDTLASRTLEILSPYLQPKS